MQARKHNDGRRKRTSRPTPRRERASGTDAALDNARDRAATNTFCPITLMRQGRRDWGSTCLKSIRCFLRRGQLLRGGCRRWSWWDPMIAWDLCPI